MWFAIYFRIQLSAFVSETGLVMDGGKPPKDD